MTGDTKVDRSQTLDLLRVAVGNEIADFRPGQWEAIEALVDRRERLLMVQRTGWGKSNVYFLATRLLREQGRGPTLIVSPLLALMRNQIEAAERIGVKAASINSTNPGQWPEIRGLLQRNEADALLISPERLSNDEFVEQVLLPIAGIIGLLVVDEAHCISDWGHDFRPDYRRLVNFLQRVPENLPILATTATANNRVIEDVREQLGNIGIQRGALMRETLALQTMRMPSSAERLAWLAQHIGELPGTGIVYTLTHRDTEQVADWLVENGIPARAYYSGVISEGFENTADYLNHLEDLLLDNELKVLVATVALGMGYDKPDLGFVVHYQAPDSIVSYYQQVGRAGRAIDHAIGILMTGSEDDDIHEYFRTNAFPDERWIQQILDVLEASDGLTLREIETELNLRQSHIERALKFLSVENPAPVIQSGSSRYTSKWLRTPVVYRMDTEKIHRLTKQREAEWLEVQSYVDEQGCLMEFLARVLDDPDPQRCGKCASCMGRPVVETSYSLDAAVSAARFVRSSELPLNTPVQVPRNAFPEYGFSGNLRLEHRTQAGRILSRWGDAGWGRIVAEDKRKGDFRDELVQAAAEMIGERWHPEPAPTWVACIPSLNHPTLVPNFARKLAAMLQIPFWEGVAKVKDNPPQKEQQNRYHQCRNLDGVFEIQGDVPSGPVLLVDDIVDSGWTLTIVSALLLQNGSGPVYPIALASTSSS